MEVARPFVTSLSKTGYVENMTQDSEVVVIIQQVFDNPKEAYTKELMDAAFSPLG